MVVLVIELAFGSAFNLMFGFVFVTRSMTWMTFGFTFWLVFGLAIAIEMT